MSFFNASSKTTTTSSSKSGRPFFCPPRKKDRSGDLDESWGSELEFEGEASKKKRKFTSTPSASKHGSFSYDFSPIGGGRPSSSGPPVEEEEWDEDELSDSEKEEEAGEEGDDWDRRDQEEREETTSTVNPSFSSSLTDEIILCVCLASGKLGAAYYDTTTQLFHLMNDLEESNGDLRLLQSLIIQVNPTTVLANSRQDIEFMEALKQICHFPKAERMSGKRGQRQEVEEEEEEEDDIPSKDEEGSNDVKPTVQLLSNASFGLSEGKRRLEELICDAKCNYIEKEMQIQFAIYMDSSSMIQSAGALLKYLDIKRIGVELEDLSVTTPISGLRTITLEKMVEVDSETLSALQIFQTELHPSAYKLGRSGGFKEGLSVFGICNKCGSTPGKTELRRWFGRPSANVELLRQRQEAIRFFADDANVHLAAEMMRALRNVKHITGILKRLKKTQASVGDWTTLYKTVFSMVQIAGVLRTRRTNVEMIDQMARTFDEELSRIGLLLDEMLDLEEMHKENRFVVRHGIDWELDRKKKELKLLPEFLSAVAAKEIRTLDLYFSELSVLYVPMLGYLICVPRSGIRLVDDHCVPGLDFVFRTGDQVHYKSPVMKEMDDTIGDVKFNIIDTETSMMLRLQELIVGSASVLIQAVRVVAQLDCLLALAYVGREKGWVEADLTEEESILEVEGCVHPLLSEVSANAVVPNGVRSGGEHGWIKVLTGPNASGKSIYLKQVGIVVYLAHVGSLVPAKRARIGIVDRIFTRMHSGDCVMDGMSTFCKDLQQMAFALRRATKKSLVVIDEFGKGTMSEVGLALLVSGLEHWRDGERGCPHVFVCSHFHAIASLIPESHILRYQTMDVLRQGTDLVFLYQLVEGSIGSSYAAYAALMAGLPEYIVRRGYQVYNCMKAGDPVTRPDEEEEQRDTEYHLLKRIADHFMEWDLDKDSMKFLDFVRHERKKEEEKRNRPSPSPLKDGRKKEEDEDSPSEEDKKETLVHRSGVVMNASLPMNLVRSILSQGRKTG